MKENIDQLSIKKEDLCSEKVWLLIESGISEYLLNVEESYGYKISTILLVIYSSVRIHLFLLI